MLHAIEIILAYTVADFLAAMYHLVTDRGWNLPTQVAWFQNHHHKPWTMTFDLQPLLAGVPIVIAGCFTRPWFLIPLGLFLALAQVPHYYTHHSAPRIVKAIQRTGLILRPALHQRHHHVSFDRDFCVLSGWTNGIVNALAPLVPQRKV